jgi:GNAT superfamily N-acetyltransferase
MPGTVRGGDAMSEASAITVRRATAEDLPAVVEALAAAFHDDPVSIWVAPDEARRRVLAPRFFAGVAQSYEPHGGVFLSADGAAAAIWAPPGVEDDEAAIGELLEAMEESAPRVVQLLEAMGAVHPTEPHHYLFLLGTRPERQGQGLGSALMRPVLEACDRDGLPAYLEATSERNRPLYERHGFAVTGEIRVPDGPTLWAMWREPR